MNRRNLAATVTVHGAACLLLSYGGDAPALSNDRVKLSAGESVTHDDNVFRLPRGSDPVIALGTRDKDDTYHTTSLGLVFDVPTGAQRYRGELAFDRHRFDRFGTLDVDGHRAAFDWLFSDQQRFSANVGHEQSRRLASMSNIQGGAQSTVPNLIDYDQTHAHAVFAATARWHVTTEISRSVQTNTAPIYAVSDLRARIGTLELAYVTPAETRIGIRARTVAGELPNHQLIGTRLVDNSYDQRHVDAFIEWQTSPHSKLDARIGRVERTHAELSARDDDILTWRAAYAWQPADTLALTGIMQRDISTTEEINVGFVLIESLGLETRWQPAERVDLTLDLARGDRSYRGEPLFALGLTPRRSERVNHVAVGAVVKLTPVVTLDCQWQHEWRTSSLPGGSYRVGVAGVGVRFSF